MGCLLEGLLEIVLKVIVRIVLLPILHVVATPFILVGALFGRKGYRENVRAYYARLTEAVL